MNAEILSIGTELLLGEIVDTNSTYIARSLRDIGVNVFYMATVGDNLERIKENIQMGLSRSDLVITTGGLGPTVDDVTRQAAANAVGRELVFHQELLDDIAEKFKQFGARMSENNRIQAYIPADAIIIDNPVGTAPCYIIEDEMGIIISLPGVPSEMKYLMEHKILPYLKDKMDFSGIIKTRTLRTAGVGESHLDEKIADYMTHPNPTVGLAAHRGQTDIRLAARAETEEEANAMLDEMEAKVRERVGKYIYGMDKLPLQNALVERLKTQGKTLAILEIGTGHALHERIKAVPDGPDVIAHADSREAVTIGDDEDAFKQWLNDEVKSVLEQSGADVAIGIAAQENTTGIAVVTPRHNYSRVYQYSTDDVPNWAGNWGIGFAWRMLAERDDD
ncbi:MAG: CinA family nicotinamide mononucleotide deamidase-related protein [Chloroflexi bacterium]|nr:CinA family nicotinamide mononucleotide deamidase-related protein [Chloroflexota bacterium]